MINLPAYLNADISNNSKVKNEKRGGFIVKLLSRGRKQVIVDPSGLELAPYGQMAISIYRSAPSGPLDRAVWRGMPTSPDLDRREDYRSGILISSQLGTDGVTLRESQKILDWDGFSRDYAPRIIGVEDPTVFDYSNEFIAVHHTVVESKQNQAQKGWCKTFLGTTYFLRDFSEKKWCDVLLTPEDLNGAFGLGLCCDMVKEAECASIDSNDYVFFEFSGLRSPNSKEMSSNIGYMDTSRNIHLLRSAKEDGSDHLSTGGAPFQWSEDGEMYMVYNRCYGGCWTVWIGKISDKRGHLVLEPDSSIIWPTDSKRVGSGPDGQCIAFASHVEYDPLESTLTVYFHINDKSMYREVFNICK